MEGKLEDNELNISRKKTEYMTFQGEMMGGQERSPLNTWSPWYTVTEQ